MLIVVDPQSGVPVYRQLMDQIRFHVASGILKPGDELPSTRALSSELGINPMTISKAYSLLEREDVVERRPGRPLVVRTIDSGQMRDRKLGQLREGLTAAVTMARQLGITDGDALEMFRRLLDEVPAPTGEEKET
ncbi:MAG: GntR family transcriptional regulator [Acidobacteriota bacterium]|jgi:GntR family transcriptional regulator